ncbi:MAG: alpha-keto acid decarboxylase family protein [Chromatiaceae bacterium]|nr:alpha-keto acid decarboxylase family protein [Chromatiaceae bacterium]
MTAPEAPYTVSDYLVQRLQEIGIEHAFGVPGDYTLDFLDHLVTSPIAWVGNCNELNAGYAADGYARVKGAGLAVVTYAVGGFSILNAVAGAYAEHVPLVVISGAPAMARRQSGALVHHLAGDHEMQLAIYRKLTVDCALLSSPRSAPDDIDRVLTQCLSWKRPVYLELPMDVAQMPCRRPEPIGFQVEKVSEPLTLDECVAEVVAHLDRAKNPAILVGTEISRFGLGPAVLRLIERIELPYAMTVSAKGCLPELHPQCLGIYQGGLGRPETQTQIEASDCLIELGVWLTDWDTGLYTSKLAQPGFVRANLDQVRIGQHLYPGVQLADLIQALTDRAQPRRFLDSHPARPSVQVGAYVAEPDRPLAAGRFYRRVEQFLDDSMILVSDIGDVICAVADMHIEEADNFLTQAYYMSIGYATPAALGVSLARPDKRPVVLVGDGAFQMTAQEVSTLLRQGCRPIILLVNNDGYLIERYLHQDQIYNDLQPWRYAELPHVLGTGAITRRVTTEGELEEALAVALAAPDQLVFIEACVGRDASDALKRIGATYQKSYRKAS